MYQYSRNKLQREKNFFPSIYPLYFLILERIKFILYKRKLTQQNWKLQFHSHNGTRYLPPAGLFIVSFMEHAVSFQSLSFFLPPTWPQKAPLPPLPPSINPQVACIGMPYSLPGYLTRPLTPPGRGHGAVWPIFASLSLARGLWPSISDCFFEWMEITLKNLFSWTQSTWGKKERNLRSPATFSLIVFPPTPG